MVSQSNDPTTGHPIFDATGAPDLGVDETEVAAYAADVGNRIVRANLAALEAYPYKRDGLLGYAKDTKAEYRHNGSGWVVASQKAGEAVITPADGLWDFDWPGYLPGKVTREGARVFTQGIMSNAQPVSVAANQDYKVGTIPAAFAPASTVYFPTFAAGNGQAVLSVRSTGDVYVMPLFTGGPYAQGSFTVWLDGRTWPVS